MAEFAKGGYIPPREGDEPLVPPDFDCGPMLTAEQVRELGSGWLKKLNEMKPDA